MKFEVKGSRQLFTITFLRHLRSKEFVRLFKMSLTPISRGKQSNDFNEPSTITVLQLFLVFLYFYGLSSWNSFLNSLEQLQLLFQFLTM